jgi:signal transduction histidine kinase
MMKKVISDYELQITRAGAVIDTEQLPVMEANAVQMNQLFQNLLSNSLKFTTPDRKPQLSIRCNLMSEDQVAAHPELNITIKHFEISFSDNGIGFDQQYAEQIFMIFKRLHGQFEFPGSGIGLSLCRKIVMNHGGKIIASGIPGQGATFTIMLPEVQPGSENLSA